MSVGAKHSVFSKTPFVNKFNKAIKLLFSAFQFSQVVNMKLGKADHQTNMKTHNFCYYS